MIVADNGKILTNSEIYGKTIYLRDNDNVSNYSEITEEDYIPILAIQEVERIQDG